MRYINGRTGLCWPTILDVAKENGIEIPTLCFSGDLEIYASCGLCLVKLKVRPNFYIHTQVADGMVVQTENKK